MSPRVSLFTGAVTTVLFLAVGIGLLVEARTVFGGIVTGLGVLRGILWLRQIAHYRQMQADEE